MTQRRRIGVWVSNDLTFDQRVRKTCRTLEKAGWTPVLVGREMPGMHPWNGPWEAHRLPLAALRGVRFYASLQQALWKWVKAHGPTLDALWCNDLDTLAPAVAYGKLPVVYDSHEYFTEAAGLTGKPVRRAIWLAVERWAVRKLPCMITVNASIAAAYRQRHGLPVHVVRNMPELQPPPPSMGRLAFGPYGVPDDLPIALMQGAYMDRDRGTAEAVRALPSMPGLRLVLVGAGVEWDEAAAIQDRPEFQGRLHCIPKLPFEELRVLTASADVGLSLDKGVHGNYEMSLPNKLFDFMHAGLPMVTTARVEVAKVVQTHGLGVVVDDLEPSTLQEAVGQVLRTPRETWRQRAMAAREAFHWGADEPHILAALETCLNAHLAGSQTT